MTDDKNKKRIVHDNNTVAARFQAAADQEPDPVIKGKLENHATFFQKQADKTRDEDTGER